MSKKQRTSKTFVFKKHDSVGAADAINDGLFLDASFVDNGELAILTDMTRPECIVLGRTGSGKTALLERLKKTEERVINIDPDSLALTYISNSDVLNFFVKAGVDMDLFYRLLWRHIFAVEIIKTHYNIVNEKSRDSFLRQIGERIFGNKAKQEAIDYLREWGKSFWKETDYRVKEITQKLENDLGTAVEGSFERAFPGLTKSQVKLNANLAKKLTEESKAEIVSYGQQVVNRVQVRVLSEIIKLLNSDILDDKQKKYFITIDRLDENWVNEELRYYLIRALIESIRDFNNVIQNVKIIIALREDLLDRVFRYTRSPGYQEEKYKSMYLTLMWAENDLHDLLNRRVQHLIKEQYTTQKVQLSDLLPPKVSKAENGVKFLIDRTLLRPRDAIMFFNECIKAATGNPIINQAMLFDAEAVYSENRLRALADEWSADYLNLIELIFFLKKYPKQFKPIALRDKIENCMVQYLIASEDFPSEKKDSIYYLIVDNFSHEEIETFMQHMIKILYRVGVIGMKEDTFTHVNWSFMGHKLVGSDINLDITCYIHPAFWRVLGIDPS